MMLDPDADKRVYSVVIEVSLLPETTDEQINSVMQEWLSQQILTVLRSLVKDDYIRGGEVRIFTTSNSHVGVGGSD